MMTWLSEWLKQIIAVILLAAVVDLLVPGKAFQRYTRLVLGLVILTAMLGPLIKLLQEDPEQLLGRSFKGWDQAVRSSLPRMPNLHDIRRDAEALREQQQRQAAELTARALEASIAEAVARLEGARVRDVRAEVTAGRGGAEIASVTVLLEEAGTGEGARSNAADGGTNAGAGGMAGAGNGMEAYGGAPDPAREAESGGTPKIAPIRILPVEPVQAVAVAAGRQRDPDDAASLPEDAAAAAGPGDSGLRAAPPALASAVKAVVHQGWGVEPERIMVLVPA